MQESLDQLITRIKGLSTSSRKRENLEAKVSIKRFSPQECPTPIGYYHHASHATGHFDLICLAGQVGQLDDGKIPEAVEEQFEIAMQNVSRLIEACACTQQHVAKITYYLTERPTDFTRIRSAIVKLFPETPPTATFLYVAGLVDEKLKVEIDVIIARPH